MRRIFVLLTILCLSTSITLVSQPAYAKPKPRIGIQASAAKILIGKIVTLRGSVSGKTKGLRVSLQKRNGSRWTTVAQKRLNASRTYSFSTQVMATNNSYRVLLPASKRYAQSISRIVNVAGYTVTPPPPPPPPPDPDRSDSGFYDYPLEYARLETAYNINLYREEYNLPPLTLSLEISDVAQDWSDYQAVAGTLQERPSLMEVSPMGIDIQDEYIVFRGKPEDFVAFLEATQPAEMLGEYTLVGIGVKSIDGINGYWTIDFGAYEEPEEEYNWPIEEARARVLADTNAFRVANGLEPLVEMVELNTIAQDWTQHQADVTTMSHNPTYIGQYPAGWSAGGENVAYGYTPDVVVTGWSNSSGHRANMLGDYTHIGIGVAKGSDGYYYYTQNFAKY